MKFISLFAFLFSFSSAVAAEGPNIELSCVTEFPTTTFIIGTAQDEVIARMINHNGMKYTPAISGVFTPNDLKILTERAELAQKLNSDMYFRFNRSMCEKGPGYSFYCIGVKEPQTVNGAKVETLYISVSKTTTESVGFTSVSHIVRLSLRIDGKDVPIEMHYHERDCLPVTIGSFGK